MSWWKHLINAGKNGDIFYPLTYGDRVQKPDVGKQKALYEFQTVNIGQVQQK